MELLFVTAHWHALAKLRMHTDATLDIMDRVTADLGNKLRSFKKTTCTVFETQELRRELDARLRRQRQQGQHKSHHTPAHAQEPNASNPASGSSSGPADPDPAVSTSSHTPPNCDEAAGPRVRPTGAAGRRPKTLNLNTYKYHALGDYTATIRRYGTTDSYSTEPVRCSFLSLVGNFIGDH